MHKIKTIYTVMCLAAVCVVVILAGCAQAGDTVGNTAGDTTFKLPTDSPCQIDNPDLCSSGICVPIGINNIGICDGSGSIVYGACKTDDQCVDGLHCYEKKCRENEQPAGSACTNDNQCTAGAACENNVCGGLGGACSTNDQCVSGVCAASVCSDTSTGSACDTDAQCASGACVSNVCSDKSTGSACDTDAQCASGACVSNVCSDKSTGSACDTNEQCTSGVCVSNVCSDTSTGSACTTNAQCASGLCNSGSCCAASRTATSSNGKITITSQITDDKFLYTCIVERDQASVQMWSNLTSRVVNVAILESQTVGTRDDSLLTSHNVYAQKTAEDLETFTAVFSNPRSDSNAAASIGHCLSSTPLAIQTTISLSLCQ